VALSVIALLVLAVSTFVVWRRRNPGQVSARDNEQADSELTSGE
jgi:hypothetical protein